MVLKKEVKKIVIFASGGGSNAEEIINHFEGKNIEVSAFFVNNPNAGAIQKAKNHGIPYVVFDRDALKSGAILKNLNAINPNLIVLAGFLWLIPSDIVKRFPNKIINIHPALLPKFGGKGMHGIHVHKAVKEAKEIESGPTIHFVNENYDEGDIIFQAKCKIKNNDTVEDIANKVLRLEHKYYPKVIEKILF